MKTLVLKLGDKSQDANGAMVYPVQLFFDDGQANWLTNPLAAATIPEDLSIANPPVDPVTTNPVDGRQIRDLFLSEASASPRFELWGDYLQRLLFQGQVAQEFNRLRGLYPGETQGSEGLRIIMDIDSDVLRWLPWELLYEAPLPLFFDPANPFARGTLDKKLPDKSFFWPIHALIVVGSVENDPAVNAEQEIAAIHQAFVKSPVPIDWEVRYRPTKDELSALIGTFKPQILHFVGHGKEGAGYSFLELTDKEAKAAPEQWTVQDISVDLLKWKPRLAFVNACRTSSAAAQKNSWDIARAFSSAGVPAVVGMQADIRGDAAAAFSGKFYEALVNNQPIDRSLAEARAAVRNVKGVSIRRRDWAVATLYLQQVPEQILDMQPPIDKGISHKFTIDSKLKETRDFVGRRTLRRKLWYGVDQIADRDDESGNLFIVVGAEFIGRTALVQASMKVCALRNRRVTYVDIGYQTTKDFVEVLKIIRAGDMKSSEIICAPLPAEPFADFDKEYGALMAQPDAAKTLAADANLCDQFFEAYKDALIKIAATTPLIIALDNLSVEWATFRSILIPKLLLRIAQNQLPNCRLILVCTVDEFRTPPASASTASASAVPGLPKELKDLAQIVEVSAWPKEKYVPLAREICLYNDVELGEPEKKIIAGLSERLVSDWGPKKLRELVDLLKP